MPATTPDAGLSSLFGQSKLGNSIAAAARATQSTLGQIASVASVASVASTTTPSSTPLFGRPVTTTTTGNTTGTLFGQPSAATTAGPFSSSFGQSVFGQPAAATSTPANVPVFGQATFGKPAQTTPQTIEVPAASSFGSSAFGQSSGTSTGFSAGTVFGQGGASTTTPVKPLFGGSAFGQTPTNTSVTSPTSNVSFGSGSVFGNIGLGGAPSAANANRNAFGGGTVFGVTPSGKSNFIHVTFLSINLTLLIGFKLKVLSDRLPCHLHLEDKRLPRLLRLLLLSAVLHPPDLGRLVRVNPLLEELQRLVVRLSSETNQHLVEVRHLVLQWPAFPLLSQKQVRCTMINILYFEKCNMM